MLETNLKVLKTNFKMLKIDFRMLEPNFNVPKLEKAKIRSVLFVSQVNGRAEMNRPDFQVANLFREIDPRRGGGWVLIVKGVSVICDIDRDKSGLRNMKNQNFQFPSAGTTFPSAGATFPSAGTENAIPKRQLPQVNCLLDCPFQKLGSRMDAPDINFN